MIHWSSFFSAIPFLFIAALPGRTTFVMVLMAARGFPWAVFTGAAAAFLLQSCISVAMGGLMSAIPTSWIHLGAGLLFLFFAYRFWREAGKAQQDLGDLGPLAPTGFRESLKFAFLVVFMAEWGDVSQVAIASLSARQTDRLTLLCSATVTLWTIAAMAVVLGSHSHRIIPAAKLQKVASFGFAAIGAYLLIGIFFL